VDETHTLIRPVTLTAANVHDRREFEHVVHEDEEMVIAARRIGARPDANGAGSRAWPTGFCASPAGGRSSPGDGVGQPAVEPDALRD
jgi:hypothetical protein